MAVNIVIGDEEQEKAEEPTTTKMSLKARRALDGSIIVTDHPDIDIVLMAEKMKIVAFAKKTMDDSVYATQNRLFDYLYRKGIIAQESVKGGNVYSSFEATILPSKEKISIDEISLFTIGKFIEEEKPQYMYEKAAEEREEERLLEPDVEDSTELGEVPHAAQKGSIIPHQTRRYVQGF